jgi:hypothetical protein
MPLRYWLVDRVVEVACEGRTIFHSNASFPFEGAYVPSQTAIRRAFISYYKEYGTGVRLIHWTTREITRAELDAYHTMPDLIDAVD